MSPLFSGRRSCGSEENSAPSWRLVSSRYSIREEVLLIWREELAGCWGAAAVCRRGGKRGGSLWRRWCHSPTRRRRYSGGRSCCSWQGAGEWLMHWGVAQTSACCLASGRRCWEASRGRCWRPSTAVSHSHWHKYLYLDIIFLYFSETKPQLETENNFPKK